MRDRHKPYQLNLVQSASSKTTLFDTIIDCIYICQTLGVVIKCRFKRSINMYIGPKSDALILYNYYAIRYAKAQDNKKKYRYRRSENDDILIAVNS